MAESETLRDRFGTPQGDLLFLGPRAQAEQIVQTPGNRAGSFNFREIL